MSEIEIVERSSGFWLVGNGETFDGPFEEIEEAQHAWEQLEVWREVDDKSADKIQIKRR